MAQVEAQLALPIMATFERSKGALVGMVTLNGVQMSCMEGVGIAQYEE